MRRRRARTTVTAAGGLALAGCSGSRDSTFVERVENGELGDWNPASAIAPEVTSVDSDWTVDLGAR